MATTPGVIARFSLSDKSGRDTLEQAAFIFFNDCFNREDVTVLSISITIVLSFF
jgi:hypothetical protein